MLFKSAYHLTDHTLFLCESFPYGSDLGKAFPHTLDLVKGHIGKIEAESVDISHSLKAHTGKPWVLRKVKAAAFAFFCHVGDLAAFRTFHKERMTADRTAHRHFSVLLFKGV